MENNLPVSAWVALGCVIVFIVILNFGLWTALKRRNTSQYKVLTRLGEAIRNPQKKDIDDMSELSQRVERFKKDSAHTQHDKSKNDI
jgi:hypothetical protein